MSTRQRLRTIWVNIKYLDQLLLDGYASIRLPPLHLTALRRAESHQDASDGSQAATTNPDPRTDASVACGATDGASGTRYGRCTLPAGHDNDGWHREMRDGRLWAEWRGPAPGERCGICGRDGSEH